MVEFRKEHPDLPVPNADVLLPVEMAYATNYLRFQHPESWNKEPAYYSAGLEKARANMIAVGKEAHKTDAEIAAWILRIENWAHQKVAGAQDPLISIDEGEKIDGLIVRPTNLEPPKFGGDGSFEKQVITEKSIMMEDLLKRLNIPYKKYTESDEKLKRIKSMRHVPYDEFVLLDRDIVILVCPESGNLTFVVHGISFGIGNAEPPIQEVDKDKLKGRSDVDEIRDFKNDRNSWEKIVSISINQVGPEGVGWMNLNETTDAVGVSRDKLGKLLELASQKYPEIDNLCVVATQRRKASENFITLTTTQCRKLLKEFLIERRKIPTGLKDVAMCCREIYEKLGGQKITGFTYEEIEEELYAIVFYEFKKIKYATQLVKLDMFDGRAERFLLDEQSSQKVIYELIAKKQVDLGSPLKPPNFIENSPMLAAESVVTDNAIQNDDNAQQKIYLSISKALTTKEKLGLTAYDQSTGQGNFGRFRSQKFSRELDMLTAEGIDIVREYFAKLIKNNREIGIKTENEKTLRQIVVEHVKEVGTSEKSVQSLYEYLLNYLGLRVNEPGSKDRVKAGSGFVRKAVKNVYDLAQVMVADKAAQEYLREVLIAKNINEERYAVADKNDVLLARLDERIIKRLQALGINRTKSPIEIRVKKILAEMSARDELVRATCGEKKVAKDGIDRGIFISSPAAQKIEEQVLQQIVSEYNLSSK